MSSKKGDVTSVDELEKILSGLQTQAAADPIGPKGSAQPLSREALERLAERINELVGGDFDPSEEQAVNEDGLPVIELNEPILSTLNNNRPPEFAYELQPLRAPPQDEAERLARQKERDAFLDALEEEERLEDEKEESEFLKIVRETKDRLQDAQTDENTKRNARTQEFSSDEEEEDEKYRPSQKPVQPHSASKEKVKGKGKNVSFAEDVKDEQKEEASQTGTVTWGDVQQARLRASLGPKTGEGIMKLNIVERFPSTLEDSQHNTYVDSDDSDEGGDEDEEKDDIDEQNLGLSSEDAILDEEDDEMKNEMEDEIQFREIAHRYHQQRQVLGSGPSGGALGGDKDLRQVNPWDREEVPLEATLASGEKEMTKSQFMATRISARSLNTALPRGVDGEVKEGKVIDGRLVNEDSDDGNLSDESIGERGRRIIEGLKKGLTVEQVLANEPTNEDGEESSQQQQAQGHESEETPLKEDFRAPVIRSGSAIVNDVREVGESTSVPKPVVEKPVKISRFKANRMG